MARVIRILCLVSGAMIAAHAADVASTLSAARAARSALNIAEAENAYNAAFELAISKDRKRISSVAVEVGTFFRERQELDKAEALLKRALDAEEADGYKLPAEIPVLMELRLVYRAPRNADRAPIEISLVKAWEQQEGPGSVVVANNLYFLAGTLEQTERFTEAEESIQRAIAILGKTYGDQTPLAALARTRFASIETKLGKGDPSKEPAKDPPVPKPRQDVKAPHLTFSPRPKYTEKARKAKIQGTVLISLVVSSNGEPINIKVGLPLGEGLDENAIEAVKEWRFQPGTKNGEPVSVQASVEVNFRLL